MKIGTIGKEGLLNAETVDRFSEKVAEYLNSVKNDPKETMRIRLSVEEILLRFRERFGENVRVKLVCYSSLGQPIVELRVKEDSFDPLEDGKEDGGTFGRKLLANLQTTPIYSYSKNTNVVTFKLVRKKKTALFRLLVAVLLGVLVGWLGGMLIPSEIRGYITEKPLKMVCDTYISVLNFFSIPLIFLSVALGIIGLGDTASFGRIGSKMFRHFLIWLLIATFGAALLAFPFFRFTQGGVYAFDFDSLLEMLLGFLPTSLVEPFLSCNAMQLIIMGVIIGIAILKLNPIASRLSQVLDDLQNVLLLISQWFTRVIPLFVFIIIVRGMWAGGIGEVLSAWTSFAVTTSLQLLFLLAQALEICFRHRVKLPTLLRKLSATFLIALGTNSCSATITEMYACLGKIGVSSDIASFGIPIGTTVFKPSCAIRLVTLSFFMAAAYGVGVSPGWIAMMLVMSVILSIAVPAIPGGLLLFYPMLFSQLGIPAEAITAMLATDVFFDAVCTAFCQVNAELALIQQAGRLDALDVDLLRA